MSTCDVFNCLSPLDTKWNSAAIRSLVCLFGFWLRNTPLVGHNPSVNYSCAQPPPLGYCGEFARFVSPRGGHLQILLCPGARHLPTPGPTPRLWNPHAVFYQNIATQRILQQNQAAWLICQGRKTIEEVCKGMRSILCMYFFIAYGAIIT